MNFRIHDPYAFPGEYRKVQLHCHTTESDGHFRPRELLRMYKDAGYSFVFITDHNRVTRCEELNDNAFLALPGTEDTVSYLLPPLGPHLGRLFVDRSTESGTAQERIDRTVSAGGLATLCHPSWTGNLWTGTWSPTAVLELHDYTLLEIWNPHSDPSKDLARWQAVLKQRGRTAPVWAVAVDDCHRRDQFNRAWVMAKVMNVSADALKAALRRGAFYASTGPQADFGADGGTIWARCETPGASIRFLDSEGAIRHEAASPQGRYATRGDEGIVRIEILGPDRGRVWSQFFALEHAARDPSGADE